MERDPPIARIILNRLRRQGQHQGRDAGHAKSTIVLHEADRDREIKVVIIKANGKSFCGGHVARWGPDENPYPDFGNTFEDLYKGTADLFPWPTRCICGSSRKADDLADLHGYCMGGGDLSRPADRLLRGVGGRVFSDAACAGSLGEPGGHTMIEPWLLMNWHRTMDLAAAGADAVGAASARLGSCSTRWCRARISRTSSRRWPARSSHDPR